MPLFPPDWDGYPTRPGAAHAYEYTTGTWTYLQKLVATDIENLDGFGTSVAVDGNVALISSPFDDDLGSSSGSAYIYEFSGGAWTQTQKLTAPDGAALDLFGQSVAIDCDGTASPCPTAGIVDGATLLVGAYQDDDKGANSGSAYVFRRVNGLWEFATKFTASDGGASDSFGKAAALGGPQGAFQAFVGAEGWDTTVGGFPYTNCGAAYSFTGVSRAARDPLEYDLDGNLISDGVTSYTYDAENRLIEVTPLHPEEGHLQLKFSYDYMGRRVRKTVHTCTLPEPGQPGLPIWSETPVEDLRFIYDGWNVVLERRFNGTTEDVVHKFAWGADLSGLNGAAGSGNASAALHGAGGIGGLLAVEEHDPGYVYTEPAKYLYFYDGNGNVGQVVTLDAGVFGTQPPIPPDEDGWLPGVAPGWIAARYEYDPYGGTLVASQDGWMTNPFRFSTKYYDAQPATAAAGERGLYYYGYRYYSPRMGRWVNRDPISELDGPHIYSAFRNHPVGGVDPLGLWTIHRRGGARAIAFPDRGDTPMSLARATGLDPSEFALWMKPVFDLGSITDTPQANCLPASANEAVPGCCVYSIPNFVAVVWGELSDSWNPKYFESYNNPLSIWGVFKSNLEMEIEIFKRQGYLVGEWRSPQPSTVEGILAGENLAAFFFAGHGNAAGMIFPRYTLSGTGSGGVVENLYRRKEDGLHKLAAMKLLSCYSAQATDFNLRLRGVKPLDWSSNVSSLGWFFGFLDEEGLWNWSTGKLFMGSGGGERPHLLP